MYAYFKLNITYVNIEICNYPSVSLLLPIGVRYLEYLDTTLLSLIKVRVRMLDAARY